MTRINSDIKPQHLIDKHLFSEYREMVRIPSLILKNLDKNLNRKFPSDFRMGNGHVLYFYDKIRYLHNRFLNIKEQLIDRGYENLSIGDDNFIIIKNKAPKLYKGISKGELKYNSSIVIERIIERCEDKDLYLNKSKIEYKEYLNIIDIYLKH